MKKMGIVTSARELNYGAILQAYALQTVANNLGYDTSLLWWKNQQESHRDIRIIKIIAIISRYILHPSIAKKSIKSYKQTFDKDFSDKSIELFQEFENKHLKILFMTYSQMKKYASSKECQALIAGSDQIWNSYAAYVDPFYYLRFAKKSKRIAYAPSLGKEDIPDYNKKKIRKYISDFSKLSIRESSGSNLLKELLDEEVPVVLDPTLLLTIDEWRSIEDKVDVPQDYILLYFLDKPNKEYMKMIKKIIKKQALPVLALPYMFWENSCFKVKYIDAGPSQFISLIDNASLVLTDSFHGSVFSIIFNKPFLTFDRQYGNNQSQATRLIDLFDLCDIKNLFVQDIEKDVGIVDIDYSLINKKIEASRKLSINYLKNAIESCGD